MNGNACLDVYLKKKEKRIANISKRHSLARCTVRGRAIEELLLVVNNKCKSYGSKNFIQQMDQSDTEREIERKEEKERVSTRA